MTIELTMLAYAILLAFGQLLLYALPGVGQTGVDYALSPRDEDRPLSGFAGRARRAYYNHLETLPLFAAAVMVGHLAEARTDMTAFGAQMYLIARVAYVPAYLFGVVYLRSLIWLVAMVGVVMVLAPAVI